MTHPCSHKHLQLECSAFAELAGFERPDARARLAATTSTRLPPKTNNKAIEEDAKILSRTFPGPLVLPWDDLNLDPECEPQSFKEWVGMKSRNKPSEKRKTVYVCAVPEIAKEMGFMRGWVKPVLQSGTEEVLGAKKVMAEELAPPGVEEFVDYLSAFYHGMDVKEFAPRLRFVPWVEKRAATVKGLPKYVGLAYGERVTRIRVRASKDGVFAAQLNLDDMLDAAIAMLPKDAYSIVLLVDHDIYEDEDDDFCCGRAYGGSRVSIVQSARYNPLLDGREKIDLGHSWPMSHCGDYVDALCAKEDVVAKKRKKDGKEVENSAMRAAIAAASLIPKPKSMVELQSLWFSRLARTVAHELGHCMGIGHCVYYACNLQGTAGMAEDVRQPPYLCPVCLAKVSYAVAVELKDGGEEERKLYIRRRYESLRDVCRRWNGVGLFVGFEAWLDARIEQLNV